MEQLDLHSFKTMVAKGAENLSKQAEMINALNVFPVPDGDTGTNMKLTFDSGMKELQRVETDKVCLAAEAFSKGLLMGARGNSGVILSQLFRGFSRSISGKQALTAEDFAEGLKSGVNHAYKAVIKPVEGTILTVAKDSSSKASEVAETHNDLLVVMEEAVQAASESLKKTPELLDVLKEVGVVDSGGQGLLAIYEGFLEGLSGRAPSIHKENGPSMDEMVNAVHHKKAQKHWKTQEIRYGYCTEFMVQLKNQVPFDESSFRKELDRHGDSLLVVSDTELVKVHIHTEKPGQMLSIGQRYGELMNMKIENMRNQHRTLVESHQNSSEHEKQTAKKKLYGIVAVAAGEGLAEMFASMGADIVIQGGQTMNPSIEDLAKAIEQCSAEHVFVLPNNGNIIMAAEQAAELAGDYATVIPAKTIPQGLSALVAFHSEADANANEKEMRAALDQVKSAQVTFAVRDTSKDGFNIKKGDYLGIADGKIVVTAEERLGAAKQLLEKVVSQDNEIVTVLAGSEAEQNETDSLCDYIEERFPDIEIEVHDGGQPVYAYIISVE